MRPKLLLLDEPCDKAREMLSEVFDFVKPNESDYTSDFTVVYTQLTPVVSNATVFCPCTGIDHIKADNVIYLDDEWKRGEGRNVTSTAEHTWSLILQLAKLKRMQLSGKTIGVIGGMGRIGKQIIQYANAFGMKHIGNDIDAGYKLDIVLQDSDIITLHVPLIESTKGMISHKEFELMKHGALLVNTSRPEIINCQALLGALDDKKIGGYADDFLDDLGGIRPKDNPPIIQTRHIGGNCIEAREATDIYIAKRAIEWWRSMNP